MPRLANGANSKTKIPGVFKTASGYLSDHFMLLTHSFVYAYIVASTTIACAEMNVTGAESKSRDGDELVASSALAAAEIVALCLGRELPATSSDAIGPYFEKIRAADLPMTREDAILAVGAIDRIATESGLKHEWG